MQITFMFMNYLSTFRIKYKGVFVMFLHTLSFFLNNFPMEFVKNTVCENNIYMSI